MRLTLWYMLISYVLLAVSTLAAITAEQRAFEAVEETVRSNVRGAVFNIYLQQQIEQFSSSFARRLIAFNLVGLVLATIASYFLSGRTLKPIENMVKEQQQFAADASHELRTPLANIAMEIEAHRRTHPKMSTSDSRLLLSIQSEVARMRSMVSGLLSLVRQVEPAGEDLVIVRLSDITDEVLQSMQARFDAKKLRLQAHIDADWTVKASPDSIRQVLLILLDNAAKYTPVGGQISVSLRRHAGLGAQGQVALIIHNSGSYVDTSEQQRIFDRFYRGQHSPESGVGLGLAIARSIIERLGGNIAVASQPEYGTSFRVILPISTEAP